MRQPLLRLVMLLQKKTEYESSNTWSTRSPTKVSTQPNSPNTWNIKKVRQVTRMRTDLLIWLHTRADDGTNIDNWTYEDLKVVVAEFVADAMQNIQTQEEEPLPEESKDDGVNFVDDDDQFENLERRDLNQKGDENLPHVKSRSVAPTSKIIPTALNYKRVVLKVTDS